MFKNLKFKIKNSSQGVSLPYVIGVLTLLMVASVSVNGLVIRAMRSVRNIESSARAWFAAEAGIEDALYELSFHLAGYETPDLDQQDVRKASFSDSLKNRWTIQSRSGTPEWQDKFYADEKLVLPLYSDNAVNPTDAPDIQALNVENNFKITFSVPADIAELIRTSANSGSSLVIDNDEDGKQNEDPENESVNSSCASGIYDLDCDGKINEDGPEDPVILWKLTDGQEKVLTPKKGCLSGSVPGSEICEKDFIHDSSAVTYLVSLNQNTIGTNESGVGESISAFLARVKTARPWARIQFEFLVIAPLEHFDLPGKPKIQIPYLDYEVSAPVIASMPKPYFTIRSDGFDGGYKQSIDTIVTPKTSVPLFDFTIIQQK